MKVYETVRWVRDVLAASPGLLRSPYKAAVVDGGAHPLTGHCYVASEALMHLLGPDSWKPETVSHEGTTHWYLRHRETGRVLDATADQFDTPVPYAEGRGRGFMTREPSKRTQEALASI